MALGIARNRISRDDYLQDELGSEIRHEYIAGNVYAMAGGTLHHQRVTAISFARRATNSPGSPAFPPEATSSFAFRSAKARKPSTTPMACSFACQCRATRFSPIPECYSGGPQPPHPSQRRDPEIPRRSHPSVLGKLHPRGSRRALPHASPPERHQLPTGNSLRAGRHPRSPGSRHLPLTHRTLSGRGLTSQSLGPFNVPRVRPPLPRRLDLQPARWCNRITETLIFPTPRRKDAKFLGGLRRDRAVMGAHR